MVNPINQFLELEKSASELDGVLHGVDAESAKSILKLLNGKERAACMKILLLASLLVDLGSVVSADVMLIDKDV